MSEKELKKTIDIVSGIEVNSEAEAIAKETLISYVEQLQQENKMLKLDSKNTYETSQDIMYEMHEKIEELTRLVSNKVMADYDYDSILKQQLNEERLKYVALEESKNIVENILTEFEKWLEKDKHEVGIDEYVTIQMILDKLQELKEGKK